MEVVELISQIVPTILSVLATIVAFVKGRTKKSQSIEQIKAKADEKYRAYVEKHCKRNKIDNVLIKTSNDEEIEV